MSTFRHTEEAPAEGDRRGSEDALNVLTSGCYWSRLAGRAARIIPSDLLDAITWVNRSPLRREHDPESLDAERVHCLNCRASQGVDDW